MKCPYDNSVDCFKISYENWVTGTLPCDKCDIKIKNHGKIEENLPE